MSALTSPALRTAAVFSAFGSVWIIVGTVGGWVLTGEGGTWPLIELVKGLLFVFVSAVLIFVVMRHQTGERQALETKLQERDDSYRQLFENHSACQLIMDPDTQTIIDANPAAEQLFDTSAGKLNGRWLGEINRRTHAEIASVLDRILKGELTHAEDRIYLPNDSVKDVELFPAAVPLNGRTVIYTVFHDCTARKEAEREVARVGRALKAISSGNRAIAQAHDVSGLFQLVCRNLVEQADYPVVSVGMAEYGAGHPIVSIARYGDSRGLLEHLTESWSADDPNGDGPAGRAVRSGRSHCVDLSSGPLLSGPWHELSVSEGLESLLAVPIFADARVKYVLEIFSRHQGGFGEEEIRLLEALGGDLSRALHVFDSVNKFDSVTAEKADVTARLKTILYELIESFGAAVDKLDPYTAGHETRVSGLAVRIARRMGMRPDVIEGILLGSLIHDIGKISVPIQILTKPGKLTPAEFALVKTHPQAGYDIVKGIHFPWPVDRIVHEHHERLDGSGYPRGLKGDDICIEAQIVAVADVVESMTTHRPYRPALAMDRAVAELQGGKGTLYNPSVIDACLHEIESSAFAAAGPGRDAAQAELG